MGLSFPTGIRLPNCREGESRTDWQAQDEWLARIGNVCGIDSADVLMSILGQIICVGVLGVLAGTGYRSWSCFGIEAGDAACEFHFAVVAKAVRPARESVKLVA